jgi:hypothetical protein
VPVSRGPEYWAQFVDELDKLDLSGERSHLITVDELRAAGALDVPASWRKSLGEETQHLFSDSLEGDETPTEEHRPGSHDQDCEESADNLP